MPRMKTNKPRGRPAKATRQARGGYNPPIDHSAHEAQLVGLTNPFSPEASNARYPDQGAGKTLTFQQRLAFTLSTDAGGAGAFVVTPKVNFPLLFSSSVSNVTATWAGTFSSVGDLTTNLVNTYGLTFRPTSMGLRIANTLGATDSAGRIVIAKGGNVLTSNAATTFIPSNFSSWDVHPLLHGGEWHALCRPLSADAYTPEGVGTSALASNTGVGSGEWETIYVGVFGSKISSNVLFCELVINYEYTVVEDSIIAQLAQRQPVYSAPMITAINEVQSAHPPSHKGGHANLQAVLKREAKKALVKHVIPFVAKKATAMLM